MSQQLPKSLGVGAGMAYCVTIMVGAGVLALPGAAYELAAQNAVLAWSLDLLLVIPLLFIFGRLMTRVQSAGGIADFIAHAFGREVLFRFSQLLLLITFCAGMAAIAQVGAQYLGASLGTGRTGVTLLALSSLLVPGVLNTLGLRASTRAQQGWAVALCLLLLTVIASSFGHWETSRILSFDAGRWEQTWQAMGLIWFAFTGIEMISFLGEDFESPRKFILAILAAFVIVGVLYLGLAIALSQTATPGDPRAVGSPIVLILEATFGAKAAWLGGVLGFTLILFNLNGAFLGASRLIFSVAREGHLLPSRLAKLDGKGTPVRCLWMLGLSSMLIVLLLHAGEWNTQPVFLLVSQNWFILYVLAILAFLKLETSWAARLLGMVALAVSCVFMRVFSWFLVLPACLVVGVVGMGWLNKRRGGQDVGRDAPVYENQAL